MGGRGASYGGGSDYRKSETISGINIYDEARRFFKQYRYVGIRTGDDVFTVGQVLDTSNVWVHGDPTEKKLKGTSATSARSEAIKMHSDRKEQNALQSRKYSGYYYGEHVAIVGGSEASRGSDYGEIVIKNAKVLKILK